jgi:probable O-glycosylation ligase (exosortase A-associated)
MRDLFLFGALFLSIPFVLTRPYLGVLLYICFSVMNPHRLTWGLAYDFNFALVIAVITLVGAVFNNDLKRPPASTTLSMLLFFVVWCGVSTLFALSPDASVDPWTTMLKTVLITILIPMLFHTRDQVRWLIWIIVLSIGYYGAKGGTWVVLTGAGGRVWGPPDSYIQDNNALAVAIVMIIPLMRYLQVTSQNRYVRWMLVAMMLLCGIAVLGSYSRGALLAAGGMVLVLWWKSRHRLSLMLVTAIALPVMLSYMPERWYQRMDTITNYTQDMSAVMRLNSWATMLNLAKDRPFVGGGFEVATPQVYERYSPDGRFPPQVAHSIYFETLGEHGFVGLAIYLMLYLLFWRDSGWLVRVTRGSQEFAWENYLGLMTQVSIVGFAVGGAFLSLANYDVPYYLMGAIVATRSLLKTKLSSSLDSAQHVGIQHIQPT